MKRVEAIWVAAIVFVVLVAIGLAALSNGLPEEPKLVRYGIQSVTFCGVERPQHVFNKLPVRGGWYDAPGPAGCVTFQHLSPSGLD